MNTKQPGVTSAHTWQRALPWVLLVAGVVGLIASFCLTYDKIQVLQDPSFKAGCNLNPVISCGAVMKTPQASTFGIPNSMFGMVAFSALSMFALALLAGAAFKRWLWVAAQVAAVVGILGMHYLFFEDVFRIHAICPWCFSVWMVTIPAFVGITVYNIRHKYLGADRFAVTAWAAGFVSKYANDILVLWYLVIFAILLGKFWYYWRTLIGV